MVGTLCEVGRGKWTMDRAEALLAAKDRAQAGPTAPARGLCLQWVRYDMPHLPPPSPELLEKAQMAEPPLGSQRAHVDAQPMSTAPILPGVDTTEEPSA
jgi:hypothetical protein